ncbi:unnamed protein product [Dimorphilus gyrociliatus]|uniref:Innexin n=1 Tax=Dimorphilus gyrociliatus TaxID=2664684 RepID=A0A7I8V545_9ANNE|nr:unnamed protein product [Dimorphilus gyrociliatus]
MNNILVHYPDLKIPTLGAGGSFTDRLCNSYTTSILFFFALLVTTHQYVGNPVICWCPSHFQPSQVSYTNNICWTKRTFYVPYHFPIPKANDKIERIGYYQFVVLILCAQMIIFYIPKPLWSFLSQKSGISVSIFTNAALEHEKQNEIDKSENIKNFIKSHLYHFLKDVCRKRLAAEKKRKKSKKRKWCLCYDFYGDYLVFSYVFIKFIYVVISVSQLFLLNLFLGMNYHMYGLQMIIDLQNGRDWTVSGRFPTETICDLTIRVLGQRHRYTVQCSLPINLFNRMIFFVLWLWFCFVSVATTISLLMWIKRQIISPNYTFIKESLTTSYRFDEENLKKENIKNFTLKFLKRDGMFLIKLIGSNSSQLIAAEIVADLFKRFNKDKANLFNFNEQEDKLLSLDSNFQSLQNIDSNPTYKMSNGYVEFPPISRPNYKDFYRSTL